MHGTILLFRRRINSRFVICIRSAGDDRLGETEKSLLRRRKGREKRRRGGRKSINQNQAQTNRGEAEIVDRAVEIRIRVIVSE